ncbi:MAG: alpha/beta hydrolase [Deltaproteobacteria bacterium]
MTKDPADKSGKTIDSTWVGPRRSGGQELVFLHEGLGSVSAWRDVPVQIAEAAGCAAFVYSRAGYGKSSPVEVPRPLTYMHDEAALLPALLAEHSIETPILVGHSDGASIAIIAAGSGLPVKALVLIAPHAFVEDVSVASIAKAADAYRTTDLRDKLGRHHADVDGAFWGWNRAWLDPEFRKWNVEAFLPRITAPTLIVQGAADEYGTLAQVDAISRQLGGPCEQLIVPGAGHAPHRTAGVPAQIAGFIRQQAERA